MPAALGEFHGRSFLMLLTCRRAVGGFSYLGLACSVGGAQVPPTEQTVESRMGKWKRKLDNCQGTWYAFSKV